ncbi:MAG TPA: Coenzyme F420 hydrogenase/dehydrogenase, beta subunit C-terminal domain [Gemmataceae bacterium]|nr:Coenzyme F420 hydrogenase/dehydrogenase, beta subunit C-terminal domain [Gemmataceae bacterium]
MRATVAASEAEGPYLEVCPFSNQSPNEDDIAQQLFAGPHDPNVGYHLASYVGYVAEGGYRQRGTAGGFVTWLLVQLLKKNLVDGIIHVRAEEAAGDGRLFRYAVSRTTEEVWSAAKSAYYPVEMSEVLRAVRGDGKSYAVVGLPCFIKAIRLLTRRDETLAGQIRYCVGLICGHLKSTGFAESLAWQCGVHPRELRGIDFRAKLDGRPANRYGLTVLGSEAVTRPMEGLVGAHWGRGYFKYKACDYCDDVVGETADISIGDAWLDPLQKDSRGHNVVTVRAETLRSLIDEGIALGDLHFSRTDAKTVAASQKSGFAHRREGLRIRLRQTDGRGAWRPNKRVQPATSASREAVEKEAWRERYRDESHAAFRQAKDSDDLSVFLERMRRLETENVGRPALLSAYWRDHAEVVNFGDYITEILIHHFGYEFVSFTQAASQVRLERFGPTLLIIGSLLDGFWPRRIRGPKIIWGCGSHGDPNFIPLLSQERFYFCAVRGPATARECGLPASMPLGDPGFTLPLFFPVNKKEEYNKVIYVPHWENMATGPGDAEKVKADLFVSVMTKREDWWDRLTRIVSAKFVLTNSLHTMIVAQAYGVPWALTLPPNAKLNMPRKWEDVFEYLSIAGRVRAVQNYHEGLLWWDSVGRHARVRDLKPMLKAFPFEIRDAAARKVIDSL